MTIVKICIRYLIIISKSDVWLICHCFQWNGIYHSVTIIAMQQYLIVMFEKWQLASWYYITVTLHQRHGVSDRWIHIIQIISTVTWKWVSCEHPTKKIKPYLRCTFKVIKPIDICAQCFWAIICNDGEHMFHHVCRWASHCFFSWGGGCCGKIFSSTCAIHSLIFISNLNLATNGMAALLPMLLLSMTSRCCTISSVTSQ